MIGLVSAHKAKNLIKGFFNLKLVQYGVRTQKTATGTEWRKDYSTSIELE